MATRIVGLLCTWLIALVIATPAAADGYCATRPPPEGLVERCRAYTTLVPHSEADLAIRLAKWMQTCALRQRGDSLVFDNPSVDDVWTRIENRRGSMTPVRIVPKYTPNRFSQNGRTCYGIAAVEFTVPGTHGEVSDDESAVDVQTITRLDQYPEEALNEAIAGAERALLAQPDPSYEKQRMLSVLRRMKSYGPAFDDTFYDLAPYTTFGDWNDPTCYKELRANRYQCRPLDDARRECAVPLGVRVIDLYFSGPSDRQMAEHLLSYARRITRGLEHLRLIQAQDAEGAVPCPSVKDVFIPEVYRRARQDRSLYNAWDAVP